MIMRKKKGIIRHETLKPLSRHHMVALHTAVKLKRAGKEESRLTVEEIINDVREFWIPDGIEHFREEEKILLVTYAKHVSIDQPIIHEMLMEHIQIQAMIEMLLDMEEADIEHMHKLGHLLESHVRKEERIIFPMIEKDLAEEVLVEMAPYLA